MVSPTYLKMGCDYGGCTVDGSDLIFEGRCTACGIGYRCSESITAVPGVCACAVCWHWMHVPLRCDHGGDDDDDAEVRMLVTCNVAGSQLLTWVKYARWLNVHSEAWCRRLQCQGDCNCGQGVETWLVQETWT